MANYIATKNFFRILEIISEVFDFLDFWIFDPKYIRKLTKLAISLKIEVEREGGETRKISKFSKNRKLLGDERYGSGRFESMPRRTL